MKSYWVYVLASRPRGSLYPGMGNDLVRRISEHRKGLADFTKQYGVKMLVYYRAARHGNCCDPTGEKHQTLVAEVENGFDLFNESQVARFVG